MRDIADAQRYLQEGLLKSYADNGFGYYLIRTLAHTPIGICGFLKKPHLQNVDFGFALLPEYTNQGYGFEAAHAVLQYGIRLYDFIELDAETSPHNHRSKRLLEKLGFTQIGTAQEKTQEEALEIYRWYKSA